ncbi:hypothetical protein ABG067_004023 [Albugo candida]
MSDANLKALFSAATCAAAIATVSIWQKQREKKLLLNTIISSSQSESTIGQRLCNETDTTHCELYSIDYSMHSENRQKALSRLRSSLLQSQYEQSAILLHGGDEISRYDTDTCYNFQQESFFQYLFGVREPGCAGMVDVATGQSVLFIPRQSEEWELWCGERKPTSYFVSHYLVDKVFYVDEVKTVLEKEYSVRKLFFLNGLNLDSRLRTTTTSQFNGMEAFEIDSDSLHPILVECRVRKSEKELDLLRYVNELSSEAHINVMKTIRPGMMEFHAESSFLHYCYTKGGARFHAYTCICGGGSNAATLHYGHAGAPNDKMLDSGQLLLNDMGAELHGYVSDITCTFPINGTFTPDQKFIYEAVLKAHDTVIEAIKPGTSYIGLHLLSHRVLTQVFLEHGFFRNGTVDELMHHQISAYFYPHGLGHLMGLDVHDVGGYLPGSDRSDKKILSKLRLGRVLEVGMVLTVEPGCYFIDAQLSAALEDPNIANFINQEMLTRFRGTGGVRIESDIIVTSSGAENMTKVPRTVEAIEDMMRYRI